MEVSREFFFTWKDVKRLFKKNQKKYIRFLALSFFSALFLYLVQPVRYQANATFKQSTQDQTIRGQSELLLSALQSAASLSKEEGAEPLLTSRTLIREVVETLGLQMQSRQFFIAKVFRNLKNSFLAELGCKRFSNNPFEFSSVRSESSEPIFFFLRFLEGDLFEVFDSFLYFVCFSRYHIFTIQKLT